MMSNEGFNLLVIRVIEKAYKDARNGDVEAEDWLLSEGIDWAEIIGVLLDRKKIQKLLWEDMVKTNSLRCHMNN
jgi:hypothetical protein